MGLAEYRRKRDFQRTAEPRGESSAPAAQRDAARGLRFVVQKHAASRLHYDFRLEWNGVLVSWAVPKGPSLDPHDKRLAVHVEDHPLEYGAFEGAIPKGEYGGGTVLVWDAGTWRPWEDAAEGLRIGKLKFDLFGEKLRGGWMLVRRGGAKAPADERNWFLIKERDSEARPAAEFDVLTELPLSVASGRDLDAIARDPGRLWASGRSQPAEASAAHPRPAKRAKPKGGLGPRRALPDFVPPQLATLVATPPVGEQWLHEIKLDGYRMLCRLAHGKAQFLSRSGQDWTAKLEPLARAASELPVHAALLDGEVVALAEDGRTNFQDLQNAFREQRVGQLIYYAFDLLHLDGHDLTGKPLIERKEQLAQFIPLRGSIRRSDYVVGDGPDYFAHACELHLEGIVSKRIDRPYFSGRGGDWLKAKCLNRQEFVIGGYTPPAGSRRHFGALLVGYFEDRKFLYAGRVGTGFSDQTLHDVRQLLDKHAVKESPFTNQELVEAPRGAKWVQPKLVAQLEFTGWTRDGLLRHASFQGLREDKPARQVVREAPRPAAKAAAPQPPRAAASAQPAEAKPPAETALQRAAQEVRELGVRFTSPEKVLYPELGVSKLELAAYYLAVADWILPHVVDRPLSIVRCPDGYHKACFFQKHPGAAVPEALRRIPITEKEVTEEYLIADDPAGLVGLVQIGGLEIHVWGAQACKLERPDQLIFDLDPDEAVPWPEMVAAARELRTFLADLGLTAFLKTTGGKGLHLVTPLVRRSTWEEAKAFAQGVAVSMARARPQRYVAVASKAQRRGKIYIDYLRNGRGATAIAPYSTRARAGATVSVPIDWDELSPRLKSDHWNVRTLPARLRALRHDPWEAFDDARTAISSKMRRAVGVQ
ncbi:MAG: DNA ligase D [Pirellulales bacterium]